MSANTTNIKVEKQLVPELRFKEFEGEFRLSNLGDELSLFNGFAFSSKAAREKGIRWVKIADVGINKMKLSSQSFLPHEFGMKYSKFLLKEGDIVVALTRPILGGKLKIAKIDKEFDCSLLNQRVGKLVSKNDLEYMYCMLQQKSLISRIENRIAGTDPPNLSPSEIATLKTFVPSLPEQQKIAAFLSAVDNKIQQLTKKKALLAQYKKGVMQQLFSGELRFKDEEGNAYPDWEEKRLGEVLSIGSGRDYKHLEEGDIPLYGSGGYMRSVNQYLFDGESVGIGRKGTIDKPIYLSGKFWTVDTLFYTHSFKKVKPYFIYLVFQYINWRLYNEASGVPSLSKSTIEKIKLNIPIIGEQKKIANYLSNIDTKIESVQNQIIQTQSYKKGLFQKMFV